MLRMSSHGHHITYSPISLLPWLPSPMKDHSCSFGGPIWGGGGTNYNSSQFWIKTLVQKNGARMTLLFWMSFTICKRWDQNSRIFFVKSSNHRWCFWAIIKVKALAFRPQLWLKGYLLHTGQLEAGAASQLPLLPNPTPCGHSPKLNATPCFTHTHTQHAA